MDRHRGMDRERELSWCVGPNQHRGWSCPGTAAVPEWGPGYRGSAGSRDLHQPWGCCPRGLRVTGPLPMGWVAVGVLPGLSLPPGPVAMGVRPVGGYQPQEPVVMGATREGLTGTGSHGSHQPWVLTGVWPVGTAGLPSHPGMHLPGSPRAPSILPPLSQPGAPGLGHGVNLPGAAAGAQLCPGSGGKLRHPRVAPEWKVGFFSQLQSCCSRVDRAVTGGQVKVGARGVWECGEMAAGLGAIWGVAGTPRLPLLRQEGPGLRCPRGHHGDVTPRPGTRLSTRPSG